MNAGPEAREAAIAEASAPDRYDEPLRVMRPWSWAAGGAILALALVLLVWSALVDVPVKVTVRGILLPPGGVVDIVADTDGRIDSVRVRPGDRVTAEQIVAVVDQSEVRLQLSLAEGQAEDARRHFASLTAFHVREETAADAFRVARDTALGQNLVLLQERLTMMQQREEVLRTLAQQNLVNRDRFLFARVEVFQVHEQIAAARNERGQLVLDQALKRTQRERETLEAERRADETARQVVALRERLSRLGAISAPFSGRVVEAKVNDGQVVTRGTAILTIEREPASGAGGPVAIIYVTAQDGKRLAEGMQVEISPASTRREEHGVVRGRIARVADVPASSAGLLRTLQNDQLVRSFTASGETLFEVQVRMEADAATRSGLRWSTGRGPDFLIESGTLAEAQFTLRSIRLIGLAFPALRRWLTQDQQAATT